MLCYLLRRELCDGASQEESEGRDRPRQRAGRDIMFCLYHVALLHSYVSRASSFSGSVFGRASWLGSRRCASAIPFLLFRVRRHPLRKNPEAENEGPRSRCC